jgi:hypothetical protein
VAEWLLVPSLSSPSVKIRFKMRVIMMVKVRVKRRGEKEG